MSWPKGFKYVATAITHYWNLNKAEMLIPTMLPFGGSENDAKQTMETAVAARNDAPTLFFCGQHVTLVGQPHRNKYQSLYN
jgi:hypothetical protein